jgi:hypothetical protein
MRLHNVIFFWPAVMFLGSKIKASLYSIKKKKETAGSGAYSLPKKIVLRGSKKREIGS